jgi:hypothetical protein
MMVMSQVDQKLGGDAWKKMTAKDLCKKLKVDGLIYPEIAEATMVKAVAYDLFKINAGIKMVNKEGKELGSWRDTSTKRKIDLPTSIVGAAATIVGAFLDESSRKQMRLVVYDWGWKVSQIVPDNPRGTSLPEVVSVDTNIDKRLFAAGEAIRVEVTAEKNLTATFNLGTFKQDLPLPSNGDGVYKGIYVVQEGDRASNQSLSIHLVRPNGVERVWLETGGTVTIDGVPPPAPANIKAQAGKAGVALTWALPQSEDLKEFLVERNEAPVGSFTVIAHTKEIRYLDATVSQGHTYYYRVLAVDPAGNRSLQDRTVGVTVPFYHEVALTGALSGTLVTGVYRLKGDGTVAEGTALEIQAGSKIILDPKARIIVNGTLKVAGTPQRPVIFEGKGWQGIVVGPRGQAELENTIVKGCTSGLENDGGDVSLHAFSVQGQGGVGIVVKNDGSLRLKGVDVAGCDRAVVVAGGRSFIEDTTLSRNAVGLDVAAGEVTLNDSNFFNNTKINIRTCRKMVLEGNYLGTTDAKKFKLEGDILVKSILDAPYPQGRKVLIAVKKALTPEELSKRFESHKSRGIAAFKERRYGDAYQELLQASKLKADREVYLYLVYTLSNLGEEKKMTQTLEQAIKAFPYEVRLYQVYVKYLVAHDQKEKALSLLERALKLNPGDQNLMFMKQYLQDLGK